MTWLPKPEDRKRMKIIQEQFAGVESDSGAIRYALKQICDQISSKDGVNG